MNNRRANGANNLPRHLQVLGRLTWACAATVALTQQAYAQTAPALQAKFVPDVVNMRTPGGVVNVMLTAQSGDLSACTLADVRMGPAVPLSIAPSSDRRTYVASFRKSDLQWVLPGF